MIKLTTTGPYTVKDQRKADLATKFIGRGAPGSSTAQYARDFGHLANCGQYVESDVVFISTNGNRPGRVKPDWDEIRKAVRMHCTIIIDAPHDRSRQYNIGEREVAEALRRSRYKEKNFDGVFTFGKSSVISTAIPTVPAGSTYPRGFDAINLGAYTCSHSSR